MGKRDTAHLRYRDLERDLTSRLCEVVDTPRALAVYILLREGEDEQILDMSIDPRNYTEARHFADDYLVTEIMSKSTYGLDAGVDPEEVAKLNFYEAERRCGDTNGSVKNRVSPGLLREAGKVIREVLPPLFAADGKLSKAGRGILERIQTQFRHGPGSVTSLVGSHGLVLSDKYDAETHLTLSLYPYARAIMGERWSNHVPLKVIVPGNRFTTVPKTAKKRRGICIEPDLNVFGQLGIGAEIRTSLKKRLGIDLDTQEWNRFLAEKSFEWHLATIDLSQASDTIARSVVEELLPPDWATLLGLFRSPSTFIDDGWVALEKWSSMGNGYTFELETLIFSSILLAVLRLEEAEGAWAHCAVYGDDIICPRVHAKAVVEALEDFGFKVNGKKSHLAGDFFESCGTDWFQAQPVRPFFCSRNESDSGVIPYELQLANALRLYANRRNRGDGCDVRFHGVWSWLTRKIPREWRHYVPVSLGDCGILADEADCTGKLPADVDKNGVYVGWEGWWVSCVQLRPKELRKRSFGRLLLALARAGGDEPILTKGKEPQRGLFGSIRTKRVHVSTWTGSFLWKKNA